MRATMKTKTRTYLKLYQVWENDTEFITDCNNSVLPINLTDAELSMTFALLYARHGGDCIRSLSKDQWKYKVFSVLFQKGPIWSKNLAIQNQLQQLTEDEITTGGKVITNASENPTEIPLGGTMDDSGLATINSQNVNITKRNKIISYRMYLESLEDPTEQYMSYFEPLFSKIGIELDAYQFISEDDEEEEDD